MLFWTCSSLLTIRTFYSGGPGIFQTKGGEEGRQPQSAKEGVRQPIMLAIISWKLHEKFGMGAAHP